MKKWILVLIVLIGICCFPTMPNTAMAFIQGTYTDTGGRYTVTVDSAGKVSNVVISQLLDVGCYNIQGTLPNEDVTLNQTFPASVLLGDGVTSFSGGDGADSTIQQFTGTQDSSYSYSILFDRTIEYSYRRLVGFKSCSGSSSGVISLYDSSLIAGDTTPPTITAFDIPASYKAFTVPFTNLTATETPSYGIVSYMVTEAATAPLASSSGWNTTPPASYTFTTVGNKFLYAWAKDIKGNISTSRGATVSIPDLIAPVVSNFSIQATTNNLIVNVTALTATDNVGVTGYLITETATTPSATASAWSSTVPPSYTFSSPSNKTLYAWAKDAAGNISIGKSASITYYTVTFASGGNGTLTGTTSQTINQGASATAVTAVPATGYYFVKWTGTGGFVTSTSNPLTAANVTANQTITANFTASDPEPIVLPQTAYSTCWDAYGTTVACTGTGQDGELQYGLAWPTPRFVDNGNQMVTDKLSGLIWAKDANLMKTRDPSFDADGTAGDGRVSWQQALDYVKKLNTEKYLGYSDWRLPNINELESLVHIGQSSPATWLNGQGFSNVQAEYYWSSSTHASSTNCARVVNMLDGVVIHMGKPNNFYVWPVRSEQSVPLAIWKTEQTACYDASGYSITCAGTGQDGELQVGAVWPTSRFSDNGDNTMTDSVTRLIWSKDIETPSPPAACVRYYSYYQVFYSDWQSGLNYIKCLNTNAWLGKTDWRMPNRNEQRSMIHYGQEGPGKWLNSQGFSISDVSCYWSSSTYAYSTDSAWQVSMSFYSSVDSSNKTEKCSVWPVRGGQSVSLGSLTISPATATFAVTHSGTLSAPVTLTLSNGGGAAVVVSATTIIGTDTTQFSATTGGSSPCVSLTPTLAAGTSCTLDVVFAPTSAGAKNATLQVTSNSPSSQTVQTSLTGTGTVPNPVNGQCGASQNLTFTTAPTTNFCTPDAAVTLTTTTTGWSWSCPGSSGGTPATCTANQTTTATNIQTTLKSGWNLMGWTTKEGYYQGTTAPPTTEHASSATTSSNTMSTVFTKLGLPSTESFVVVGPDGVVYMPGSPFNTLKKALPGKAYWIYTPSDKTITVPGTALLPTDQLPLSSGWTQIAYWGTEGVAPATGFACINGKYDILVDESGKVYMSGSPFNTLKTLQKNKGYFIHTTAPATLVYQCL
jgi:uncharacterized repeat protein (TIGR02543 family)